MGIDTVVRGEEWISSTPKHLLLYKWLGVDAPNVVIFDCVVDKAENCLPMIPSGKAHNDMILPDEIDDIGSVIDDKGKMLV